MTVCTRSRSPKTLTTLVLLVGLLTAGLITAELGSPSRAEATTIWSQQTSGVTATLNDVSCPSVATCYAVGSGKIISTSNGGTTWTMRSGSAFAGISCPSTTTCYAIGGSGSIVSTTDNGNTWSSHSTGVTVNFRALDCPSIAACFVVGDSGTVVATTDGANSWTQQSSTTTRDLDAVACPTASTCYAVGTFGTVVATSNGGATWTAQSSGAQVYLSGVSCPSTTTCYAVGGHIVATTNGGATWTEQIASGDFYDVSCVMSACSAVGNAGGILGTSDGGSQWQSQSSGTSNTLWAVSCPSVDRCWAVGNSGTVLSGWTAVVPTPTPTSTATPTPTPTATPTPTQSPIPSILPGGFPSDDCDSAGTNVLTGFVSSAYVKAKTAPEGMNATWVCVAAETGGAHGGGKLALNASPPGLSVAQIDLDPNSVAACATNAKNVRVDGGQIAGQPWWVDVTPSPSGSSDSAWVCVRLTNSAGFRLRFAPGVSIGVPSFSPDSTSPHLPAYVENPWPAPTQPSSVCQVAGGTRVLNLTVLTTPLALYTWQESLAKAHLCVRAGSTGTGGAHLAVDAHAADTGISTTSSTTPCPFPLFTSNNPSFGAYTSNPSTGLPASACVAVGTTARGVTVNKPTVGSVVTFQQDAA
jgi:photosystem II stability/assembly factor-like uncharacterized protein